MHKLKWAMLLTTSLPGLAHAQSEIPQPPVRVQIDENGIDLLTGKITVSTKPISIGNDGSGFSFSRHWVNNAWISDYDNFAEEFGPSVAPNKVKIYIGTSSYDFDKVGDNYVATEERGDTLVKEVGSYIYTDKAGVKYSFTYFNNRSPNIQVIASIAKPDGEMLTYAYERVKYYPVGSIQPYKPSQLKELSRPSGISSNRGYSLTYKYLSDERPRDTDYPVGVFGMRSPSTITLTNTLTGAAKSIRYTENIDGNKPEFPTINEYGSLKETRDDGTETNYTTSYNRDTRDMKLARVRGAPSQNIDFTYVADGKIASVTQRGVTTNYTWAINNIILTGTITSPSGTRSVVVDAQKGLLTSDTDPVGRTRQYQYDASGKITQVTLPEGGAMTYGYDARGNVTQVTQAAKPGTTEASVSILAGYPATCALAASCNKPDWTRDAGGNQTDYTYDPTHGAVASVTAPAQPNGVRPQTRYAYTQPNGVWLLSGTSVCRTTQSCTGTADETRTDIAYDGNGLPVSQTVAAGDNTLSAASTTAYDGIGNVSSIDGPLPGTDDAVYYRYDGERRKIGEISGDPDGAGPLPRRATRTAYNVDDTIASVDTGTVTGISDAEWAAFSVTQHSVSTYDTYGRKISETLTAGSETIAVRQFAYDSAGRIDCTVTRMNPAAFAALPGACELSAAGPNGNDRITRIGYDAADQPTQVTTAYGTPEASTETKGYTGSGKTAFVTDAEGNRTDYVYDGLDRLSVTRFPTPAKGASAANAADYEQFGYDPNGNMLSRRLRDGQTIQYTYDALSRRLNADHPNSSIADSDISYTYDNLGRQVRAEDNNGWFTALDYDALGSVVKQSSNISSNTLTYDAGRRLARQTWADGFFVTYDYRPTGDVSVIRENGDLALASFAYDGLGRRTSLTRGNGTVTRYDYDGASRLRQLDQDFAGTDQDQSVTLTYNLDNQISQRTATNNAYTFGQNFTVDRAYQSNGLNQYTQSGDVALTYDGRGNLTGAGAQTYQYNSRNQLYGNGSGQLFYTAPNGLLSQIPGYNFDYVGPNLVTEMGAAGVARRYVFGPGTDEPLIWYEGSGTTDRRYLYADERGSIIAVGNDAGVATTINTYDDYGIPGSGNVGRFQYTGQKWIAELGLYDYKARTYSPTLGRFMQTDPIGYDDGLNWYSYAAGDPINGTDPTGQFVVADDIIVTAGALKAVPFLVQAIVPFFSGIGSIFGGLFAGNSPPVLKTQTANIQNSETSDIVVTGQRVTLPIISKETLGLYYVGGLGGTLCLSSSQFASAVSSFRPTGNRTALRGGGFAQAGKAYGTSLGYAYGAFTLLFNSTGKPTGFLDNYDFNSMRYGVRDQNSWFYLRENTTRIAGAFGKIAGARDFNIRYPC